MKFLFKTLFTLLLIVTIAIPAVLIVLSFEKKPGVAPHEKLSYEKINRVKKMVDRYRPASLKKRQVKLFSINETDLNLVIDYALSQGVKTEEILADIQLMDQTAMAKVTYILPSNPLGEYLNLSMAFKNNNDLVAVQSLKIGKILVPGPIINPVISFLHSAALSYGEYRDLTAHIDSIQRISINPGKMQIVYDWDPDSFAKLQESSKRLLLPEQHQTRMVEYWNRLQTLLKPYQNKKVSLARILPGVFKHARQLSQTSNDPIFENRAAIQVLALYSNGMSVSRFVSRELQGSIDPIMKTQFLLANRKDLPKHFLISAGLAVSGGSRLANFIGLAKEVGDSDGGSGFSFPDLAADRAGVRFAELATVSATSAKTLQNRIQSTVDEADFMPSIDRLPKAIQKLDFKKRYNDIDSKSYNLVNLEIDRRISDCLLYQSL